MKKRDLREEREFQRRHEIRRSIIHAAEDIIGRKGYGSVTMDGVARAAQVSKATLYQYVRNKSELVMEIILHSFEDFDQEFNRIWARKAGALDKLKELIQFFLEFHHQKENLSNVLFMDVELIKKLKIFYFPGKAASAKDRALLNRFRELHESLFRKACDLVREGVRSGEFRHLDPEQAVIFINSVLEGYNHGKYWFEKKLTLGEETDFLSRFLLEGIKGADRPKGDMG